MTAEEAIKMLIELLDSLCCPQKDDYYSYEDYLDALAEYLVCHGARIVQTCKNCRFNIKKLESDPLDIVDYSDIVCTLWMTDGVDETTDYCSRFEGVGE